MPLISELSVGVLRAAAIFVADNKDPRTYLNSVALISTGDAAHVVSTDGKRLFVAKIETIPACSVLIPVAAIKATAPKKTLVSLCTMADPDTYSLGDSIFKIDPDLVYPHWINVIPREVSGEVAQFDSESLGDIAKANKALSGKKFGQGHITIEHNGPSPAIITSAELYENHAFIVHMPFRATSYDVPQILHDVCGFALPAAKPCAVAA